MKALKRSASIYLVKNFWRIAPMALLPALFFAYCAANGLRLDVEMDSVIYASGESFMSTFVARFFTPLGQMWWVALVGVVLLVYFIGVLVAQIETHMRYGVVGFAKYFGASFRILGRVALYVALLALLSVVALLVVVGATYLFSLFVSGIWLVVLSACLLLLGYVLAFAIAGLTLCALPAVQRDDYKLNLAISYSVRLISAKPFKYVGSFVALSVLLRVVLVVCCIFVSDFWVLFAVCAAYYLWWFSYFPCLCCKTYEDFCNGDRRDVRDDYGRGSWA